MNWLALWALTFSAFALCADMNLKGVKPGMSTVEALSAIPTMKCTATPMEPAGDTVCEDLGKNFTYGGRPAKILVWFIGGKATVAHISIDSGAFSEIAEALATRYGPAHQQKSQILTNRLGAKFENLILSWDTPDQTLEATKYSIDGRQASIILSSSDARAATLQRAREIGQQRAKDL